MRAPAGGSYGRGVGVGRVLRFGERAHDEDLVAIRGHGPAGR